MKISFKGDYAIKAILFLAYKYEEHKGAEDYYQNQEISKSQDIPIKFLEQIMLNLKNAGFVKSLRGQKGGYAISKAPSRIKLGEIIRAIDGPTSPIACVSCSVYKYCDFESKCVLKPIWEQVRDSVSNIVDNITFADLVEKEKEKNMGRQAATYII